MLERVRYPEQTLHDTLHERTIPGIGIDVMGARGTAKEHAEHEVMPIRPPSRSPRAGP